jgi:hypothetical protein
VSPGAVIVRYRGRLGNKLAQYCLGRIIASELGFALAAGPPLPGFPGTGSRGDARGWRAEDEGRQLLTDHRVPLADLLADRRPRVVLLHGLFLRYEYFRAYKAAIREAWLAGSPTGAAHPDDLTIHIRAGDIWQAGRDASRPANPLYPALPFSFYRQIVDERPWRQILIVTEDAGDPMARKLAARFGAAVRSDVAINDFDALRASSNIVLSVSTFAWWAAWLSRASRVYYPVVGLFDGARAARREWARQQDLWVDDELRYLARQPVMPPGDWTGSEDERRRLLEG